MKKYYYLTGLLLLIFAGELHAQISVDAGLTPSKERWIFRLQSRYMERENRVLPNSSMRTTSLNSVLAYGLRSDLAIIVKANYQFIDMEMSGMESSVKGLGDVSVIAKYLFYRLNEKNYTLGMAGTAGFDIPLGQTGITSDTWNFQLGVFSSLKSGFNSFDINFSYNFEDIPNNKKEISPGNQVNIDFAYTRQFLLGPGSDITLAPVVEIKYVYTFPDIIENGGNEINGESLLYLAPGIKYTISSFIVETLLLFPVSQHQNDGLMKVNLMGLFGMRYMF